MENNFLEKTVDFNQLLDSQTEYAEKYVLKNNESSLRKIFNFFASSKNILLINGFAGTGKKQIVDTVLSYIQKNTFVCKFVCTQSTTIHDFYMFLATRFRLKFSNLEKDFNILTNYKDKVQFALSRVDFNMIFSIYGFDNLLEENKQEFIDYINALTDLKNLKTVIVSRTFDSNVITNPNCYSKIMIKALSKELFESYFKDFDLNVTSTKFDQLYRLTRGYYFYCMITLKLLINQGMAVDEYLNAYFSSGQTYDKFIANSYYKLIIGTTKNAFNLFIQLRHGLNESSLAEIGAFPVNVLKTLHENSFIYKVNDMYYPSNFLKEQLKDDIKDVVYKSKLVKYYSAQREKSPAERDFIISRESLVNEVTFYTETDITVKVEKEREYEQQKQQRIVPSEEVKQEIKKENTEIENLSSEELLSQVVEAINQFDYIKALKFLSAILTKQASYANQDIIISSYHLLVQTYSKLSKWDYALYYVNILEEYYKTQNDKLKIQEVLFERGNLLYKQNKIIDAISIMKRILANTTDKNLIVKSNLLLSNISLLANNNLLALSYIKSAIANLTENTDKMIISEVYFQYAYLSDEHKEESIAVEYYKKCIENSTEPNKYSALSYSNLGEIFYDKEDFTIAKEYFTKANEVEKVLKNEYGIYYTLSKIVELTPREEKDTRLKLMADARAHAINSRDNTSIIESTIALGDMFYDYSMPQEALIEYFNLYSQGKDIIEHENLVKLKNRINDMKARLGKDEFEKLAPNYE